jgi:hypothetical protein
VCDKIKLELLDSRESSQSLPNELLFRRAAQIVYQKCRFLYSGIHFIHIHILTGSSPSDSNPKIAINNGSTTRLLQGTRRGSRAITTSPDSAIGIILRYASMPP